MRSLPPLAVALALAACGAPGYYLLPTPQPGPSAGRAGRLDRRRRPQPAGLRRRLEVATLTGPGTLELPKASLWADTPRRAMTRHLAAALDDRLGARVATEPWPGFDSPGLRVEVTVDRMIGALDGGLDFAGQYFLVAPASGRIVALDRFAIAVRRRATATGPDGRPRPRPRPARRPHRRPHHRRPAA